MQINVLLRDSGVVRELTERYGGCNLGFYRKKI